MYRGNAKLIILFTGPLMTYSNNYGFNLGVRTGILRDLDRGQRPEKYISLSDPSYNHSEEGLSRFNFDSGNLNYIRGGTLHPMQTPQRPNYVDQNPNIIPLHLADMSRPPPGFSNPAPRNPVPAFSCVPPNCGGSFTPVSDYRNDNEDEYEGMILVY